MDCDKVKGCFNLALQAVKVDIIGVFKSFICMKFNDTDVELLLMLIIS